MIERLERDGQVAVVYSPGYGAGWSTWSHDGHEEFLVFDKTIAERVLAGDTAGAVTRAKEKVPDLYPGGANDLRVEWVPKGAAVRIDEYDGSESVVIGTADYMVA